MFSRLFPLFAAAFLACTGCSQAVPVYLTTSDAPDKIVTAKAPAVLDEGFGFWGLDYELTEVPYGSVYVGLIEIDEDAEFLGTASQEHNTCRRVLWSDFNGPILAHELGHAFGLKHSSNRRNIMHPRVYEDSDDYTDTQWDTVQGNVDRFLLCK